MKRIKVEVSLNSRGVYLNIPNGSLGSLLLERYQQELTDETYEALVDFIYEDVAREIDFDIESIEEQY